MEKTITHLRVASCQTTLGSRSQSPVLGGSMGTTGFPAKRVKVRPRSLLEARHWPRPMAVQARTIGGSAPAWNPALLSRSTNPLPDHDPARRPPGIGVGGN